MGAADVHLDHDGRAAICGDVNAVGRVNNEGLVDGVVALEGLTGIRGRTRSSTSTSGLRGNAGAPARLGHAR